jgi:hypothetical protein
LFAGDDGTLFAGVWRVTVSGAAETVTVSVTVPVHLEVGEVAFIAGPEDDAPAFERGEPLRGNPQNVCAEKTPAMEKKPSPLVTVRALRDASLISVTSAPGMTAHAASLTIPSASR